MRSQRALVKRPEELSPGGIGWRIGVAVAIGIALVAVAFWLYQLGCPAATALSARSAPSWPERSVCGPIRSSPPWLLLSTLAASPAALLTWYWRTRHKERDLALAHDEQATARFVSAVQLLAKEADPVAVIGGIYALERVARDSPWDRGAIIETLAALVRKRWPDRNDEALSEESYVDPPAEVQAAITVLGRLPVDGRGDIRIDLRNCWLYKVALTGNFRDALFDGSTLNLANIDGGVFDNASFRNCWMDHVDLARAQSALNADLTDVSGTKG